MPTRPRSWLESKRVLKECMDHMQRFMEMEAFGPLCLRRGRGTNSNIFKPSLLYLPVHVQKKKASSAIAISASCCAQVPDEEYGLSWRRSWAHILGTFEGKTSCPLE